MLNYLNILITMMEPCWYIQKYGKDILEKVEEKIMEKDSEE